MAVSSADPIVTITSIMSQSDEIFASGADEPAQSMGAEDNEYNGLDDGAEALGEVQSTEPAVPTAELPEVHGKKVRVIHTVLKVPSLAGCSCSAR